MAADQDKTEDAEMESPFKYRAFISYSHKDKTWGEWLHRSLERYKVPEQLVGTLSRDGPVPKSLFPIFRDREELPSSANLNDQIRDALDQSAYLIVVCSPNAVFSRWVNEEIALFKKLGREDRILAFIVAGEPNASDKSGFSAEDECFPPALQFRFDSRGKPTAERLEPVAADARPQGDGKESAKLKLIAGLLGVGYDALRQREVEAARRRTRFYRAVMASIALLASSAVVATYFAYTNSLAERVQRNNKLITQSKFLADLAAQSTASGDHELAMLLALEALPDKDANFLRPYVPEAERALFTAQQKSPELAEFQVKNAGNAIFLSDGKRILTFFRGNMVVLHTESGKVERWPFKDKLISIAFDASSSLVAAAFDDKTIRIWNSVTNEAVVAVRGVEGAVRALAIRSNGQRVTALLQNTGTNSESGTSTVVWDVSSGRRLFAIAHLEKFDNEIYFSPDSKYIVTYASPAPLPHRMFTASTVKIIDADTGKKVSELTGVDVMHAAFSPDGRTLFTGSSRGKIQLWNIQTGKLISALEEHEDLVYSIRFSSDGLRFLTSSLDTVRVWDTKTGKTISLLRGHLGYLQSASLSADGKQVVTTFSGDILRVWRIKTDASPRILSGHKERVNDAAFNSDGRRVVTSSDDGSAAIWDAESGKLLVRISNVIGQVYVARFSADGRRLITFSSTSLDQAPYKSNWIQVWDAETGKLLKAPVKLEGDIFSVNFSRDGRRLIARTLSESDPPRIFDSESGKLVLTLRGHKHTVMSAEFDPSGKRALTTSLDGTTRIWDAESGAVIAVFRDEEAPPVMRAIFDSDGLRVVTITRSGIISIWDVTSARKVATFDSGISGTEGPVLSAKDAFSLKGARLLRALPGGILEVRDVTTGEQVALLREHPSRVWSTAFAPNSEFALTASSDGTARIWQLFPSTEALIEHARKLVPSCLTRDQREKAFLDLDPPNWCIEMGKWPYNLADWKLWLKDKRAKLNPPRPDAPEWKKWNARAR